MHVFCVLLTMSTCNGLGKVPTSHVALEVALETKPNLLLLTEEAQVSSRFHLERCRKP